MMMHKDFIVSLHSAAMNALTPPVPQGMRNMCVMIPDGPFHVVFDLYRITMEAPGMTYDPKEFFYGLTVRDYYGFLALTHALLPEGGMPNV